jgi:preprotein translocase subunit SecE
MAQESKDKERDVDEDEASEGEGSSETMRAADDEALVKADGGEGDTASDGEASDEDDGEGEEAAAQLGTDRYVLAGFFAVGMLGAYVLGRALQSAWTAAANKDWFSQRFPVLTAVTDDDKGMYGIVVGGVIAAIVVYRTYKKPEIRTWSDEVAAELAKVVWPSRKEVTNSTFIVIVASAVATLYLALLDRLWAFVTNIVYGDGS